MERLLAPPLQDGCPWSGFTPPNVNWCEEELCSWIVNPADTWSNLAYVLFGLWMIYAARGSRGPGLALFGPASIAVGICSGVYHASYTYLLQLLDFAGMYLFCFLILTLNSVRLGWIGSSKQLLFYGVGVASFTAVTPLLFEVGAPIQGLVGLLIFFAVGQEIAIRRRRPDENAPTAIYLAALGLLAGAAIFSAADVTRTWCDPENHWLQGHALWHLLSAASLAVLFRFYQELAGERGSRAAA